MKISTLSVALLLVLPAAILSQAWSQEKAQDQSQTKEKPEAAAHGQATAEAARAGKFKAGKALADTVKSKAPDPDYRDEDSDDDGLSDATERAHEAAHTVQQKEGVDATKRKRPGRTKYADITLKKGAAAADDATDTDDKTKKSDKKKGDNN